jgi:hypothetical protein
MIQLKPALDIAGTAVARIINTSNTNIQDLQFTILTGKQPIFS